MKQNMKANNNRILNVDIENINDNTMEDSKKIFFQALRQGKGDDVKESLAGGMDPNEKDLLDATALMIAAHGGYMNIVKELLEKGADVNAASEDGVTALMTAAYEGHLDIIQELINHGADVNAKSHSGLTALSAAQNNKNVEVIKLLTSSRS